MIIIYFLLVSRHSLLDQKINNVLSVSNDTVILASVQSIIQNMVASEDAGQQPLHFLQSCGFGGLWRFAGPFAKVFLTAFFLISLTSHNCMLFSSQVQYDDGIVGIVRQLLRSDGRNVLILRRRDSSGSFAASISPKFQHE